MIKINNFNSCDLDFFQQAIKRKSVFRQKDALDYTYLPKRLFMRNDAIASLIFSFRRILPEKNLSVNCLLIGGPGSGKTTIAKFFAKNFREIALESIPTFSLEYYNCIEFRGKSSIIRDLVKKYCHSSGRGFGGEECWIMLLRHLTRINAYLFVILDEIHNLPQQDILEFLYLSETFGHHNVNVSFLLISREKNWNQCKDIEILNRLYNTIKLSPYNFEEAYTILSNRCEIAFKEGVKNGEILTKIAQIVIKSKNMRQGIDLLRKLGLYIDKKGYKKATVEMLNNVSKMPYLKYAEILNKLRYHEFLAYKSVLLALANSDTTTVEEAYLKYKRLCEELHEKSYVIMQFRRTLRNIKNFDLLNSKLVRINPRGQHLVISLPENANESKQEIETYLNDKFMNE